MNSNKREQQGTFYFALKYIITVFSNECRVSFFNQLTQLNTYFSFIVNNYTKNAFFS